MAHLRIPVKVKPEGMKICGWQVPTKETYTHASAEIH